MALVQLNPMLGHCVQNFANYCTPCSFNAQHFGNHERIVESKKRPIPKLPLKNKLCSQAVNLGERQHFFETSALHKELIAIPLFLVRIHHTSGHTGQTFHDDYKLNLGFY